MKLNDTLFGKSITLTGSSCIALIETAAGESLAGRPTDGMANLFGRPVLHRKDRSITQAMGMAAAGQRTQVSVGHRELAARFDALEESVRDHLGYVMHVATGDPSGFRHFCAAGEWGWIQLIASSVQDVVDLTIVGHRLAELSLTPVMIAVADFDTAQTVELPTRDMLTAYLGQPDDLVECPTASQRTLFGRTRRRIPNWFHFDVPTATGMHKTDAARVIEVAAIGQYFHHHIPALFDLAAAEYSHLTGRSVTSVAGFHHDHADFLVLAAGPAADRTRSVVDHLRSRRVKAGCVQLSLLRPFPEKAVCEAVAGRKGVTTLDAVMIDAHMDPPLFRHLQSVLDKALQNAVRKKNPPFAELPALPERQRPILYSGQYGVTPGYETIETIFRNMTADGKRRFFVNIDLAGGLSSFPKQQIIRQTILREYPGIGDLALTGDGKEKIPTDRTCTVRLDFDREVAVEDVALVVTNRWHGRFASARFAKTTTPGYHLSFTREASPYPLEKDTDIDAVITHGPVLKNAECLAALKKGASVVVLCAASAEPLMLSDDVMTVARHLALAIHDVRIPVDLAPSDVVLGTAAGLFSDFVNEGPDGGVDADRIEKSMRAAGETWTDARRASVMLGLSFRTSAVHLSDLRSESQSVDLPMAVRQYRDEGPPYTRVSQFFDRYGYDHHTNTTDDMTADSFAATSVLPPATLNFANTAMDRERLPQFVPERCTACGQCFVFCPHSAIPPLVISVESMLKYAADTRQSRGTPLSELTPPIQKNLGKTANGLLVGLDGRVSMVSLLTQASDKLAVQLKLDGEKAARLHDDVQAAATMLSDLPVSVTKPFFKSKETGHLFTLAINPQSCTGCGLCADVCPEGALTMTPGTNEHAAPLAASFRLWEQLPDTPADMVEEKYQDPDYDPFAAILLSRHFYMALVGGSLSELGAVEKMATHLVTAVAESVLQSGVNQNMKDLEKRIVDLTDKIQNKLREAMPTGNLDRLLESISGQAQSRVSLDQVIARLGETERFGVVESAWIERLIRLINELKNLAFMITDGPSGTGRSRFGAVIAASDTMRWTRTFPYNAFTSPVWICNQEAPFDFVAGLLQGHLRQAVDNVKLLRRADLEIKNQYDPSIHDLAMARLGWNDLTETEKSFVPPVLLFVDNGRLSESGTSTLIPLLSGDWPVKVIVLDDAAGVSTDHTERLGTLMSLISVRNCPMLQSSLATPRALFEGLRDGLHQSGPAFFRVLCPNIESPHDAGLPSLLALALHARLFPTLRFRPGGDKKFVSTGLDLSANPEPDKDFCTVEITYRESGEERSVHYALTYGDWAIRQPGLRNQFRPLSSGDTSPMTLAEFLAIEPSARTTRTPVVYTVDSSGELHKQVPSANIIRTSESVILAWNTIQEIAGLLTPYPAKLKASIEDEVTKHHEKTLEKLRNDYEEKLREQQRTQMEAIKKKLTDKLLALSGHGSHD